MPLTKSSPRPGALMEIFQMQKAAYKTRQQDLLFSYLNEMKGKHFTADDVRSHFEQKNLSIGIATI